MQHRFEMFHVPPEKELFLVLDNSLDGYVVAECETAEEAQEYIRKRCAETICG